LALIRPAPLLAIDVAADAVRLTSRLSEVVKHRRYIEQFLVEGDAVRSSVLRRPQVRAEAVVD
jgi:hypothetical protein